MDTLLRVLERLLDFLSTLVDQRLGREGRIFVAGVFTGQIVSIVSLVMFLLIFQLALQAIR